MNIETKPDFRPLTPKVVFQGNYESSAFGNQPGIGYDVSPDGSRFLMVKRISERPPVTELRVVQDWFEELKKRVPAGGN